MDSLQEKLESLFAAALEIEAPAERAAFLDRAAGDDAELRRRVERLLTAHGRSEGFFHNCHPVQEFIREEAAFHRKLVEEEEVGRHIGPYKLLQRIGEGGWGMVYMAEQERPVRRRVALKIIKLGMDTKSVIARFEAERQALAMMDHPNIARVLDAGATESGRPYFVMELVSGIRITQYCDERQLTLQERLELFIQVCHAIQHAHQKGIIHRDIKPSNILITHHDGEPVPKVIDFGIAKAIEEKLTDKTLFTVYGHFIGTPAYMSPEQADYSALDIDTRSDIYSLGVLLYELLTGKTPFEQKELLDLGIDEMRRTLREREPYRPSLRLDRMQPAELTATALSRHLEAPKLQLILRGDLDWIVMKALEKDRKRRYETANGLGLDIRRYLRNEPVMARPPSRWYQFRKLVRRNRVVFAAAGAVSLALIIGLGAATWLFFRERTMRQRAMAAEHTAEQARATEADLRRQAETREKIAKATYLISQGKMDEAGQLAEQIVFREPTLDGAAVARAMGEWHVRNGQWREAAGWLGDALQVDQLDAPETVAQDVLRAGAALAMAGEPGNFDHFRRGLAAHFAADKGPGLAESVLRASLFLPAGADFMESLQPLARAIAPVDDASIGNTWIREENLAAKLQLQNVGTAQPSSLANHGGLVTVTGGGSDIYGSTDEFAYAFMPVQGDFDYRMRVRSIAPALDSFTRVGLMARESSSSPGARHMMIAVNANGTFQVIARTAENAFSESLPQNPLPENYGSNSWVRLQRVGTIFHAYTSSNGVDWAELYSAVGRQRPFSDLVDFGIAVCAHSTNAVATSVVSDLSATATVTPEVALTLALWELRAGRLENSAVWCRRLLAYPEAGAAENATAQVILALAEQKLHHAPPPATDAVRQMLDKKFAAGTGLEAGNKLDGYWFDWVLARELSQESSTPP